MYRLLDETELMEIGDIVIHYADSEDHRHMIVASGFVGRPPTELFGWGYLYGALAVLREVKKVES